VLIRKSILAALLTLSIFLPEVAIFMQGDAREGVLQGVMSEVFTVPTAHAQAVGDAASKFIGGVLEIATVLNWIALTFVQELMNPNVIF